MNVSRVGTCGLSKAIAMVVVVKYKELFRDSPPLS